MILYLLLFTQTLKLLALLGPSTSLLLHLSDPFPPVFHDHATVPTSP